MVLRDTPYGAFNFLVNLNGNTDGPMGGFSDVSGLNLEITSADYRNGNEKENHVRKVPGVHKVGDVTLKRGVISSGDLYQWMNEVRHKGYEAKKPTVTITLCNEVGEPVQSWILRNVMPIKYTGPTLAAKGGGDVAMEELVLSAEGIDIE